MSIITTAIIRLTTNHPLYKMFNVIIYTMAKDKIDTSNRTSKKELKLFKNHFYLQLLHDLKNESSPKMAANKYNKSIQNIQFYITNLKEMGYVRKVGYGTWELTKLGESVTTKKFTWGSQEDDKSITIWRMGFRFHIKHDNPIPDIKEQTLKNGGKVYQGHILGCWVMKGKETLDIYGTVSKSSNLWSAGMKAISEIVTCKGYIESEYHLMLDPMQALKPDIIIDTPETREIAEKIHKDFGVLRTEFFDVDGGSKTGRPELEARTLSATANALDNLGLSNHSRYMEEKVTEMAEAMRGYMPQQLALSNAANMQAVTSGKIETAITKMADVLARLEGRDNEDPLNPGVVRDTDLVKVTFTEDTESFMGILRENEIGYEPKRKGQSMILERLTADMLVSNGKADITSDPKGARG